MVDINTGPFGSNPAGFANVSGTLFFAAQFGEPFTSGQRGRELWMSDGTAAGTVEVADIFPGAAGSSPKLLTAVGGRLFFEANDGGGTGENSG